MNTKKKSLLFVIPSLKAGGAERVFLQLLNIFDTDKFNLIICTFVGGIEYNKTLPSGIKIISLNKTSRWQFFCLIFKFNKLIHRFNPIIVFSALYYANIISVLACFGKRKRPRVVLSEHSYPGSYLRNSIFDFTKKQLIRFTYKRADAIIAVSKQIKEYLIDAFALGCKKVVVIYNPVDIDGINRKSQEPVSHPFFDNMKNIVFIGAGRLTESKRFDRLIICFKQINKINPDTRLIILGKGELKYDLEKLVSSLDIKDVVDLVGFQSNPYKWLARSDIFVLSSDREGFPVIILESMCCGIPIIATDCLSGPKEIITNNRNGLLVSLTDIKFLKDAMLTLADNVELRQKFAQEAREKVKEFSTEIILPEYKKVFNILIGQ